MSDDAYHVHLESVEAHPDLGADQGLVEMRVQFLVDRLHGGPESFVLGRARFAPGRSGREWRPHVAAEEFALIVKGEAISLDGENEVRVRAATSCSAARASGTVRATPPTPRWPR